MDALRALANLAVMAVVSVVLAAIWDSYHPDQGTPFTTIWFVAFLLVWALVAMMNSGGRHKRH